MDVGVIDYLAKWGHFLFGITWIGLLYYFNFVQVPAVAALYYLHPSLTTYMNHNSTAP